MLDGIVLDKDAVPPDMERAKSDTSRGPLAPSVLNTDSLKLTTTKVLPDSIVVPVMVPTLDYTLMARNYSA